MTTLICGSFAYDTIMVFHDRFKNHILPDQIHILNVSFHVPTMRREFGGCAGNIAFNLKLLGGDPLPMATVGEDFEPYARWMDKCGVPRTHVTTLPGHYTAQAFITTDLDDNQITAFHPGAMNESHRNRVKSANGNGQVGLAIVSPDGRDGMLQHARDLAEAGIPFIFDPGQAMPLFSGEEFRQFLELADYACLNDYECRLLMERTDWSINEVAARVKALIVTKGEQGAEIRANGKRYDIPPVRVEKAEDPTGCGDAFRGGLLHGLTQGCDWETTGRMASLMGAIKIVSNGTQNHGFARAEFDARFETAFGYAHRAR